MLQRIQSIWLLLASAASFASLKLPFYTGHILNKTTNQPQDWILNGMSNVFLMILVVAVAVAALIFLFLYKDRKKQMQFCIFGLIGAVIVVALNFWQMQKFIDGTMALTSLLTFSTVVFYALAVRGIWKDEQLVKSVDRLR